MRIAVISHPLDSRLPGRFLCRLGLTPKVYQIEAVLLELMRLGHQIVYTDPGQKFQDADAAILHVDETVVPDEFLDLAKRYEVVINQNAKNISKRNVSSNLLTRDSTWAGPVIIKTDLNVAGAVEQRHRRALEPVNRQTPYRETPYRVLDRLAEVEDAVWDDPWYVVEKFQPERRGAHFVLRIWNFMGAAERCTGYTSPEQIAKGRTILTSFPSEVPDLIRQERERLGADYGKFDFALTEAGPVLFDANKTSGFLRGKPEVMAEVGVNFAAGALDLIKSRRR